MENKTDITSLRGKLPRGSLDLIAGRVGVHKQTVLNALRGDLRSPKLAEMTRVAAEVYAESKVKLLDAENEVRAVLSETPEQLRERLAFQREKYGESAILSH